MNDVDEPTRLGYRQRLHQHLIEERKNRRGRANAEREHRDDGCRKARPQKQLPKCVLEEDHLFDSRLRTVKRLSFFSTGVRRHD
ncbi:MAG TPA: hypothetical protein VFY39_05105 [Gammaproteobacteria bacterium]|nr:hypothetical protein [Gammaproteobacteria bacterium]